MTKPRAPWRCQRCGGLGKISPRATPRSKICTWCAGELGKAGQRWCTAGRHGAAIADFASQRVAMCRGCQHDRNQAYRQAHLDQAIAASRAYYAAHRDDLNAAGRAYYQAHREQLLEQKRQYYQQRRELIKAKVRAHRPHISSASHEKARQRHRARHQVYKHNEKLARARRFMASLRGAP